MIRSVLAALAALISIVSVQAQQLQSGRVLGNPGAAQAPATAATMTAMIDRAVCGTNGSIIIRSAGTWGCQATGASGHVVPFLDGANTWSALQTFNLNSGSPTAPSTPVARFIGADGVNSRLWAESYGAAPFLNCRRANGTGASPTAIQSGNLLCVLGADGYGTSAYNGTQATWTAYATQAWTNTAAGTRWVAATTPNGSTTPADRIEIAQDGGILVPPTVTGGSAGAGAINASGIYVSGVQVVRATATPSGILKGNGTYDILGSAGVTDLASTTANRLFGSNGSGVSGLVTLPATGLSLSAGALSLTNDLAAVEGLSTTGCAARTATDTWNLRTITGTSGRITVTNGDCVAGNPTLDLATTITGAGPVGSSTAIPIITFDNFGRLTAVSSATVSGVNGVSYPASFTSGGIPYASSSSAISSSGALTANGFVLGGGTGAAPTSTARPTAGQLPFGQTAGAPVMATISGNVVVDASGVATIQSSVVTNAMRANMTANTVSGNPTGSSAAPQDVAPATARSASLLNVDSFTGHGDSNYTILATDKVVGTNAAFTASRTWTLPAANAVNGGQPLIVSDFQGTVTGSNTIVVARAGSDTINGGTSITISSANGAYAFWSDGSSRWTAQAIGASATSGVSSLGGATGAITLGNGLGISSGVLSSTGWTNTRLAKTAAYTAASADCGDTIALAGSAFYALTFTSGSGYASTCAFAVANEDAGRAKTMLVQVGTSATSFAVGTGSKAFTTQSGLSFPVGARVRAWSLASTANWMSGTVTSYSSTTLTLNVDATGGSGTLTDWQIGNEMFLWPGQVFSIINQNNIWQYNPPERWRLSGDTTLNVDHANGVANADCLGTTTGACPSITLAFNRYASGIDVRCFRPTIDVVDETFTESAFIKGPLVGGRCSAVTGAGDYRDIYIVGNVGTPTNAVWQVASGSGNSALVVTNGAAVDVQGFKLVSTSSGQEGLQSEKGGTLIFGNMQFEAFSSGDHLFVQEGGHLYYDSGTYVVNGAPSNHIKVNMPGDVIIVGGTNVISLPNALTFANFALAYGSGSTIQFTAFSGGGGFTGTGSGTGSTGNKCFAGLNGTIVLNGATPPGNASPACTTAASGTTGGQIAP